MNKQNIKKDEMSETHITWKVRLKGFLNPRLGRRRRNGVWPPSNPNLAVPRAFWPLWPRPAVFPKPDPIPRPFLFFCFVAPGLSLRSFKLNRVLYALIVDTPFPKNSPFDHRFDEFGVLKGICEMGGDDFGGRMWGLENVWILIDSSDVSRLLSIFLSVLRLIVVGILQVLLYSYWREEV